MHFGKIKFNKSVANLRQLPETTAEVAFVGRSNAGKSSALNALCNNKKLAKTSKSPGCTQLLNFFQTEDINKYIVDLPGYGFAKAPIDVKNRWQQTIARYLTRRDSLKGIFCLMDIRHPLQKSDLVAFDLILETNIPVHIVLTKADKLKRAAANKVLLQVKQEFKDVEDVSIQLFSIKDNTYIKTLQNQIASWLKL